MDQFERLKSRLLLVHRQFSELDFVDAFISGLNGEIKPFVKAFKPITLEEAFEYALHMESATDNQYKRFKGITKVSSIQSSTSVQNNRDKAPMSGQRVNSGNFHTRNALVDQRRALGLCFKCGEKYFRGHQCKIEVQMLLGQEEEGDDIIEPNMAQELTGESVMLAEEAIVSMHATSSNPQISTMRFKGQIGTASVFALIDSGSIHSLVNPAVLKGQSCQIVETHTMIVMVANGERIVTNSKCEALSFSIQEQEFTSELRLLQVKGYDVILGLDWLSQLGPIQIDWRKKWLEFSKGGKTVRLQVQEETACIKAQSDIMLAHIWLCEEGGKKEDSNTVLPELQGVLSKFTKVFETSNSLPPEREVDHSIPPLPNSEPINLRPYRYSYFQKVEIEKIIEELLKIQ